MQYVFWLRRNRIAGRSGPDLDPWYPDQLAAAGIGAVVSVNQALSVYPNDLARAGLSHAHFPMADNAPPRPGDFEYCIDLLPRVFAYLAESIDAGRIPLVHCSAGKDRTGLVLCDYLCRTEVLAPLDAIRELRRVRPIALSAPGYEDFAIEVLTALHGGGTDSR
ncbi:MAG: tyrosine-protein phosphatase [Gammaproteobacteria bacterium]|jgi:protein-tyrosine phosphatase